MKLTVIPLAIQSTSTATAQSYVGPQIFKVLDLKPGPRGTISMFALVDETRTQTCDQYVLKQDQPLVGVTIQNQPITSFNMPAVLKAANGLEFIQVPMLGPVVVMSYCFA